jgi:Putative MetA-pathway of phenol degradation
MCCSSFSQWFVKILVLLLASSTSFAHAEQATLFRWHAQPQSEQESEYDPFASALASDRPDFTEASSTVGAGVKQLEMGYTFTRDANADYRLNAHSYPEFLLRTGLFADWFELRVGWNYASESEKTGTVLEKTAGAEDLYLGIKLGLTKQEGMLPEMALMPQMTVPTGAKAFSSSQVLPGLNWLYGWDINDKFSTAGSTQINLAIDGTTEQEYLEFAQSWTVGYSLTEKLGSYGEWFMFSPAGAETERTQHYLNGGLVYNISNDLQLDARIGKGISAAAEDYFIGSGLVVRW